MDEEFGRFAQKVENEMRKLVNGNGEEEVYYSLS
jgi:hypothetical protein